MRYLTALTLSILLSACGAGMVGSAPLMPEDTEWRATTTETTAGAEPAWATSRDPIYLPGDGPRPERTGPAPSGAWPAADVVIPGDEGWPAPEPEADDLAYVPVEERL